MTHSVATAAIADAALRLGVPVLTAPPGLRWLEPPIPFDGPARPVTHLGSVDVILAAIDDAEPGDVLVIDNGGRRDEAAIGDLLTLEARAAGLGGIVLWGLHRDSAQLREIGLPVASLGGFPYGPRRVPPAGSRMPTASLDGAIVTEQHHVFADSDGVLIARAEDVAALVETARAIAATESAQAERMRGGASLREQLDFAGFRAHQAEDPTLTFRRYLAERGGAIEV
ncbi:MAG: RraA family protein [Actinomycetales bacterium]|nr:RraA family protein [Actinomycetales bacterium]